MSSNLDAGSAKAAAENDRAPITSEPGSAADRPGVSGDAPGGVTGDHADPSHRVRGASRPAAAIVAVVVTLQALLIAMFAWPAINMAPRDLPVIVAAPPEAAAAVAERLTSVRPGAFKVSTVADEDAATRALRDRRAYAAFVVRPDGPRLLVASAASPAIAQLFAQQAQTIGGGQPIPVVDVIPSTSGDPRGAGFAAGFLPLILTSMVVGILLATLVPSKGARLAAVGSFSLLAGLAGAAVLQYWLDVLSGPYLRNAAVIGLLALAVCGAVAGLAALLGPAGIAIAVLLIFLVGNPLSAVASAPEMLPQPWGAIGQLLPPGAGATLLRSSAFFDGAGGAAALWTLSAWATAGLVFLLVGRRRAGHGLGAG